MSRQSTKGSSIYDWDRQPSTQLSALVFLTICAICLPQRSLSEDTFQRFLIEHDLPKSADPRISESCFTEKELIFCESFEFNDVVEFRPKQKGAGVQLNATKTETRVYIIGEENYFAFQLSVNGPVNGIAMQQYLKHKDAIDVLLSDLNLVIEPIKDTAPSYFLLRYFPNEINVELVEDFLGVSIHSWPEREKFLLTEYPRIKPENAPKLFSR